MAGQLRRCVNPEGSPADYDPTTGFGTDPTLAPGVYFYRVSTAAGQAWKGTVEVVR